MKKLRKLAEGMNNALMQLAIYYDAAEQVNESINNAIEQLINEGCIVRGE